MDGDDAAVVITVNMKHPYSPYIGVSSHIMVLAVTFLLQPYCVYVRHVVMPIVVLRYSCVILSCGVLLVLTVTLSFC